jgi:hypothetical protein
VLVVDYSRIQLEALTTKCNKSEDISNASQIIDGFLTIYVVTSLGIIIIVFVAVVVQAGIIVYMLTSI